MSTATSLTVAEFYAWTADREGVWELVGGVPVMVPPESHENVYAASSLQDLLRARGLSRQEWFIAAHAALDLPLPTPTLRLPDLLVARLSPGGELRVGAANTLLVVEVLSPSTARTDLGTKRREYARAGIPNYLVVDVRGPLPTLRLFNQIVDNDYLDAAPCDQVSLQFGDQVIDLAATDLLR